MSLKILDGQMLEIAKKIGKHRYSIVKSFINGNELNSDTLKATLPLDLPYIYI